MPNTYLLWKITSRKIFENMKKKLEIPKNLLWGCLCDSKLQKTKKFTKPFRRAGGTQAEKSAKFGQNGLCALSAISKMASWIFLFFAILNHINIPITDFEVRIRCYFFSSELPCQLGWEGGWRPSLQHTILEIIWIQFNQGNTDGFLDGSRVPILVNKSRGVQIVWYSSCLD